MESNENIRKEIITVIQSQIDENNPPETGETYNRLIKEGYTHDEAFNLISLCLIVELYDGLKDKEGFNEERYLSNLENLPDSPLDYDDDEDDFYDEISPEEFLKKKIFIKDWLKLKPYTKQVNTDIYYMRIANEIKTALVKYAEVFNEFVLEIEDMNLLACILASYFEDIISETNIWQGFVNAHKQLYSKQLPFFEIDEYYYEGEINEQDLTVLVWYFFNTIQTQRTLSPTIRDIKLIAEDVLEILEQEYETAPENKQLKEMMQLDPNTSDFYEIRAFIEQVYFNSYLFHIEATREFDSITEDFIEENKGDINEHNIEATQLYLHEMNKEFLSINHTRLLSLRANEWVANILGAEHPLSEDIRNISKNVSGYFFYKGQDKTHIMLEHIATTKQFKLIKDSFDKVPSIKNEDTLIYANMVKWRNEWWLSGGFSDLEYDADLILDEKNSVLSRQKVAFLDAETDEVKDIIKNQYEAFLAYNNNSEIAFVAGNELDGFVKGYFDFYNTQLGDSKGTLKEASDRMKKKGFFADEHREMIEAEDNQPMVVFFNKNKGLEFSPRLTGAFKLKENKFFNEKDTPQHIMNVFMAPQCSVELAHYCIEKGKDTIDFLKKDEVTLAYLKDLDFMLRFWKKDQYKSLPDITVV